MNIVHDTSTKHTKDEANAIHHDEQLNYRNNIEFVNYMETVYIKSQLEENTNTNTNLFQLKNYSTNPQVKFTVLDFAKKSILSKRFSQNGDTVSAIAVLDDIIFTGNHSGTVVMYSCEKEYQFKSYISTEIENSTERSVVSMDISHDGNYLISGYSNGYLALWEINTTKCLKLITNAHTSTVLACKFIRTKNKKKFEVLSSDLEGNVIKIIIKDGLFSFSFDVTHILKLDSPVFLISILPFNDISIHALLVAFGCMESIFLFMIEPEMKKLFQFDKPKYFKDSHVPDICFGYGYLPSLSEYSACEAYNSSDFTNPNVLLAISIGNIVYIYFIPFTKNNQVILVGHYINTAPIIRIGFISTSIVFVFDSKKTVKAINTTLITPGEVKVGDDNGRQIPIRDFKYKPELEEGRIVDPDIQYQNYLWDKIEKKRKETYHNFIIYTSKNIFLLGKRDFHHGRLLTWDQSLFNLQQNSEWIFALSLGLDIYHGRMTALADIPTDPVTRKAKVGAVLRGMIHHYTIFSIGNDKSHVEKLRKCINICIEFCIEIESIEYLLSHICPIFDSKGYGDEFILRLCPFILSNQFINQHLQVPVISTIIELYIRLKKPTVLSQLLIHLNVKSLNFDSIKKICLECNLHTPLIYIYMNGSDEEYFFPIEKMYEIFLNAKQIPKSDFVSYQNCVKRMPIFEIETSKQYIGHKMLWYVSLCLDEKKYPDNSPISEDKYPGLVIKISYWILSDSILTTLLNFDSFSLFLILTRIFSDEKILQILSSISCDNLTPLCLVDTIVTKCKELNNTFILQNMYEFISKITCCTSTLILPKSLILESGKFLLTYNSQDDTSNADMFNSHANVKNFSKYVDTMSKMIIDMIDKRKDLERNDYLHLLSASELSPFVKVKIHLLKINKEYVRCLGVYLQKENYLSDLEVKVFDWIDETLRKLQDEDKQSYEEVKEEVLNNLHILAKFSIERVTKLVETWYSGQQDVVIRKLDNAKDLQLRYVENQLEKYKDDTDTDTDTDISCDNNEQTLSFLLKLHIKLLCKLNKSDQVLPNLQKRAAYPADECLKICLKYQVNDAAIYLYQTLGAIKEALALAIEILNTTLNSIILELNTTSFNENFLNELIECHKNNLKQCIGICEKHSEKEQSNEEVWFLLLKQLYNVLEVFQRNSIEGPKKQIEDFSKMISNELRDILDNMCYYVSIQRIIENITTNYQDAEFKEFKELLLKMLPSYSHLRNILTSAKNLLANTITYSMNELKKKNMRGNKYILLNCDCCGKLYHHIDEEVIYVFRCGHTLHHRCVFNNMRESEVVCSVCLKNEIESSVTSTNSCAITRRVI